MIPSRITFALAIALTAGCAGNKPNGSGGENGGGKGVVIMPADPLLAVDGASAATLDFKVYRDGHDVTATAVLAVDNTALGTFSGARFSSVPGVAGRTTVRASVGSDLASTSLTLKTTTVVIAPGAPADSASRFGGAADASHAPAIAYPPDGALIPPNLNELEVQFSDSGNTLFEVGFSGDAIDLRIYTTCNALPGGCGLTPDEATWKLLSQAARGQALTVTVRGTSKAGGSVGSAPPQTLTFADEDMEGGLYYWGAGAGGIYRYDFGRRGQKAEEFYTPKQAPDTMCVGCHALSRNGKHIAVGLNAPTPAPTLRLLDVATRKTFFDQGGGFGGGSNYEALTPDGQKVLTTETGGLTIHDAQTGKVIGATLANANMPDVSPDGTRVVFARDAAGCQFGFCMTLTVMSGALYTVPFTGVGFGAPKALVTTGGNNYYPSYSPDGQFVVFNRSKSASYDAADARVMAVSTTSGGAIDLQSSNTLPGNSWPKWAPFIHHFQGSTIMWVTFSSRRAIGLRGGTTAQLWMVPLDAAKLSAGQDPGFPPVWLPFQDPATGNHIAQWVEKVERAPCSQIDNSGCMQGEMCENGVCVPKIM